MSDGRIPLHIIRTTTNGTTRRRRARENARRVARNRAVIALAFWLLGVYMALAW